MQLYIQKYILKQLTKKDFKAVDYLKILFHYSVSVKLYMAGAEPLPYKAAYGLLNTTRTLIKPPKIGGFDIFQFICNKL